MGKSTIKLVHLSTASTEETDEALWERAIVAVTHAHGSSNYYNRHWMPLLRGSAARVVAAMLKRCSFNQRNWAKHDNCYPAYRTIAEDAGVSVRTVANVLHRATAADIAAWDAQEAKRAARDPEYTPRPCPFVEGQFSYTYEGVWIGGHIERFITQIERRWRFSEREGHMMRSSNIYRLAVIMPYIEAHRSEVEAKYHELNAQRAIAMESARGGSTGGPDSQLCTYTAMQSLPQYCDAKFAQQDRLEDRREKATGISISRKVSGEPQAIGNRVAGTDGDKDGVANQIGTDRTRNEGTRTKDGDEGAKEIAIVSKSNEDDDARGVAAGAVLSEREMQIAAADAIAGATIESLAEQHGDTNPRATRKHIVAAGVDAGATGEQIEQVARLARNRVARFQARGGHVANLASFYLNTARNAMRDARRAGWNVERIDAKDREKQRAQMQVSQPSQPGRGQTRSAAAQSLYDAAQRSAAVWGRGR